MTKRTEEQWQTLFQQHDESGLTAAQFCRDNKLCPKYFSLRRKQLLRDKTEVQLSALPFVPARLPVKPPAQDKSLITLNYYNCQLQVPASINEKWLAGLLKALC